MTACLRCDGCGNAVAEHEADLTQWWRLARHGDEWAEEAGLPHGGMHMHPTVTMQTFMVEDTLDDHDVVVGLALPEEFEEMEPPLVILHFCSSGCLSEWAFQAATFETDEETP